jgi:glycosyltransferase involved in cell wall biosynthesis
LTSVSIIVPTYNRAALVGDAICSCLRQRGPDLPLQVLVIDDASTDSTSETLKPFGKQIESVRLARNSGVCAARNLGLQHASGDYVKFLDSDDVLEDGILAREVGLARQSEADIVVSGWGVVRMDAEYREQPRTRRLYRAPTLDPIIDSILRGEAVPTSSALYRRAHLGELAWDGGIGGSLDDWDFFCQAALRTQRILSLSETAYWMREHAGARITGGSTMLANAIGHHRILRKIEHWLETNGELTGPRRQRLAQYYFKELRVLSMHDRLAFDAALIHIFELDPRFVPRDEERQWWMRALMRAFGVRPVLLAHTAAKRFVRTRVRRRRQTGLT